MKNALIVTANKAFLPGLNALLNSLDYYGNTPDVHIIHTPDLDEYIQAVQGAFNFKVIGFPISRLEDVRKDDFFNYTYTRYKYVEKIRYDYNVISHFDADTVCLNNIMPYYEIAARTTLFVVPASTLCQFPPEGFTDEALANQIPLFNHPCFYSSDLYGGTIQRIWDIGQEFYKVDGENDTISFNRALFRNGTLKNILALPGNLWIANNTITRDNFQLKTVNGKIYLHTIENHRIQVLHGKYWQKDYLKNQSKAHSGQSEKITRLTHNVATSRKVIDLFNNTHKVKLVDFYNGDQEE